MKSKIAAGLLAFFAGPFGVHRFYLGETGKGILYLLFFWFPLVWLIAFIDGIVFLTMNDNDFDFRYNNVRPQYHSRGYDTAKSDPRTQERRRSQNEIEERRRARERERSYQRQEPVRKSQSNPYKLKGTQLYKEYDFRGAIEAYLKSLTLQSKDPQIHFNLACLYSLQEDPQASFHHLSKAVEQGYNYFDKIKTHDHLAYLRTQPQFDDFVQNGYSLRQSLNAPAPDILNLTDDVIAKLERLGQLKERGILTEDEFQEQKTKLLNGF